MNVWWERIRRRKVVQWVAAYLAAASIAIGVLSDLAQGFPWAVVALRTCVIVLAVGLLAVVVIAWYHGEQGRQRPTAFELLLLSILFFSAVAGGWAAASTAAAPRSQGTSQRTPRDVEPGEPRTIIAVLPCTQIPANPSTDHLAIGIADQVISELSRSVTFEPIALTSVTRYHGLQRDIRTIANDLSVASILDCTMRQHGSEVRVTFHLIEASTQTQIWSEPYAVDLRDIIRLETDFAVRIAEALDVKVSTSRRHRSGLPSSISEEAWFDYLRGRQLTRTTERDLESAISYFEKAINAHPDFALAHAGLADVMISLGFLGLRVPREARDSARSAANRALALDDGLGEAFAALAGVRFWFDWDWAGAEEAFKRAKDLQPASVAPRNTYASLLIAMRRFEEAFDLLRENVRLDPLNPYTHAVLGWAHYMAGSYGDAISHLEQTRARFPEFTTGDLVLAWTYAQSGRYAEALAAADRVEPTLTEDPWLKASLAVTRAGAGHRAEAQGMLTELTQLQTRRYVDPRNFAVLFGALGDTTRALTELENAYRLGSPEMVFLDVSRDGLFHRPFGLTPRYAALLRMLRFPR
jgi:adenylate cyclase